MGFSLINQPFLGTPFMETPIWDISNVPRSNFGDPGSAMDSMDVAQSTQVMRTRGAKALGALGEN